MNVSGLLCFHVLRRSVLARGAVPSAVYGAHLILVVAVTGDRVTGDGLLDALQVLVGECYVRRGGVLLQALAAFGTRDGYYVVALGSSQARASYPGVAPFSSAISLTLSASSRFLRKFSSSKRRNLPARVSFSGMSSMLLQRPVRKPRPRGL
jgi:hypothetical protein